MPKLLRHADALVPTIAALLYVMAMYCGGFALLIHARWWSWPPGVIAVAHAMVIASYLVHECAHNAVFTDAKHNSLLGRALLWINGASYGDYEAIRHKHMRHHIDRADVIAIDYREWLQRHSLLRRLVIVLEFIYVPAVDCLMHGLVIALPFLDRRYRVQRKRVLINLAARGLLLISLFAYSWQAFCGYVFAYLLFAIVLRTMDMHQHTYAVFTTLHEARDKAFVDRDYEQHHTYSNPLGRSTVANWLVLNFGFHNAHHAQPTLPWYRLPALDRELDTFACAQRLDFIDVLRSYRKYRVLRILDSDGGNFQSDHIAFAGVLGVSFLTPI